MRRTLHRLFHGALIAASASCCALALSAPASAAAAAPANPAARMDERSGSFVSGGFYEGTFSDGTAFQMNLMSIPQLPHGTPAPPASATLRSAYWEAERPRETTVWMRASRQRDEIVVSTVPAQTGGKAPVVTETFVGETQDDGATVSGVWTRSTGEQRDFSMKRRFPYVTEYHRYVTLGSIAAFGSRPTETVIVHPQTSVDDLDDAMPTVTGATRSGQLMGGDDKESQSIVTVAWASPRFLFLAREDYQYAFGAAHGNGSVTFSLYDVHGQQVKDLGMSDFLPSVDCVEEVSDKVVAALAADHASMPQAGVLLTDGKRVLGDNYLVLPNGIDFYFAPSSTGKASGAHDVFVPKSELGRCGSGLPRLHMPVAPRYQPPTELPADAAPARPPTEMAAGIE